MTRKTYREIFETHDGREASKWDHYFDIYDTYFSRFRGQPITMMEIGVGQGGSLEIWRDYFGPKARIIGVDINPDCLAFAGDGIEIIIGDQGDREFMNSIAQKVGPFDIILDDGSHQMEDLRASFLTLFGSVNAGGLYVTEDLHTCYWPNFGGGHRTKGSFLEDLKGVIDHMHAYYSMDQEKFPMTSFTLTVKAVHFHDSVAVIEKTLPHFGGPHANVPRQVSSKTRTGSTP